jgi:hypothetical protein
MALMYLGLIWAFKQIGVEAHAYLPYPVEQSIGRYDIGETDRELTLAGYAFMTFSIVVGANLGAALYYRTLRPWKTVSARATSRAWWFISDFMLFCLPILQLLNRSITEGLPGLIVSSLEVAVPVFVSWKTWLWWKKASAAMSNNDAQ